MQVGLLTNPFGSESLDAVIAYADKVGFDALEVGTGPGSKHLDPNTFSKSDADRINALLEASRVEISSLACYMDTTNPEQRSDIISMFRKIVDAADLLEVKIVCALAGLPYGGRSREQMIDEDCKEVFTPIVEYAAGKGIKIALENWYATNIQNLSHFDRIFQVIPNENFGLNFDPSHLVHQSIDYLYAVNRFRDRIFHTHAKDTEILEYVRNYVGVLGSGWWRYVIPGCGVIKWGEYISHLRKAGFDGVLSIEHEDGSVGREQGFEMGLRHLKQFM